MFTKPAIPTVEDLPCQLTFNGESGAGSTFSHSHKSNRIGSEVSSIPVEAAKTSTSTPGTQFRPGKKGQHRWTSEEARAARAKRKTYGKKLPPLRCDNCAFARQCPQFRPGYECAFLNIIGGIEINTFDDILQAMLRVTEANLRTAYLGLIQQRLAGGAIDQQTSARLDAAFEQLSELRRIQFESRSNSKGHPTKPAGTGLFARIFCDLHAKPGPEEERFGKMDGDSR